MKKITFLLFVTVLSFGCSSSDNSSSDSNIFNPPSWIHGTWGVKYTDDSEITPIFRFSSDNVCQIISTTTLCWKESIQQDATNMLSGDDTSTNNTYSASFITGNGTLTTTINFEKISATKILWVDNVSGDLELEKIN
jgi:hypothetical protein